MTTEDDFQAALDKNPADWQTRLVFADWLEDHGDPRAEGYRALGVLRIRPKRYGRADVCYYGRASNVDDTTQNEEWKRLPDDWFERVRSDDPPEDWGENWRAYHARADAENAAARAFAELPAARRAELLRSPPVGP